MNNKEKILMIIMFVVLVVSVGLTYNQTVFKKSFEVINIEPDSNLQDSE